MRFLVNGCYPLALPRDQSTGQVALRQTLAFRRAKRPLRSVAMLTSAKQELGQDEA